MNDRTDFCQVDSRCRQGFAAATNKQRKLLGIWQRCCRDPKFQPGASL